MAAADEVHLGECRQRNVVGKLNFWAPCLWAVVVIILSVAGASCVTFHMNRDNSRMNNILQKQLAELETKVNELTAKCSGVPLVSLSTENEDREVDDIFTDGVDINNEMADSGSRAKRSADEEHRRRRTNKGDRRKKERKGNKKRKGKPKKVNIKDLVNTTEFREAVRDAAKSWQSQNEPIAIHLRGNLPQLTQSDQIAKFKNGLDVELNFGSWNKRKGYRPHSDGVYRRWKVAEWAEKYTPNDFAYNGTTGELTVKKAGLYFIYSQILFNNAASRSSHAIKIGDSTFVQCVQSVDYVGVDSDAKYKSCYIGATTHLKGNDTLTVVDQYKDRWVNLGKESSYWGAVRLSLS